MNEIVLGVDQGIASCGYAFLQNKEEGILRLESGVILTAAKDGMPFRINKIYEKLNSGILIHKPSHIAGEKLFFNPPTKGEGAGGYRNKSASMMHSNMISGILNLLCGIHKLEYFDFVPGTVKKEVTGFGRASKPEVIATIKEMFNIEKKIKEHEADAIAVGVTMINKINEERGKKK